MPLGRAGRKWFVAAAVVTACVAVGAGLAQPWASEPGAGRPPGGAFDTDAVETDIALDYHVVGVTELRGELVALTSGGEVVRSRNGRAWEKVTASGFTPRRRARDVDGEACAGDAVRGVAAWNGLLLAVGQRAVPPEPGDEYCDARLRVWVSTDATTWNAVEPSGLAETDAVDTVVADTSGFLAFGYTRPAPSEGGDEEDEEQGRGLVVWRSLDGTTWQAVPTDGLSRPTEYKYQAVNSVAVRGDRMLAAAGVECVGCFDDDVVALWRSDGEGAWQELKFSGLDALDQANSDIIPAVAATKGGYLLFASVGRDHGDDRTPALWSSADGRRWNESALTGPSPSDGAMDAATAWSRGVVALDSTRQGLVVWLVGAR
jgi:hypothetical protein